MTQIKKWNEVVLCCKYFISKQTSSGPKSPSAGFQGMSPSEDAARLPPLSHPHFLQVRLARLHSLNSSSLSSSVIYKFNILMPLFYCLDTELEMNVYWIFFFTYPDTGKLSLCRTGRVPRPFKWQHLPWLQGKTALQAPAFLQLLPQPRTRTPKPGKHAQSSHTHFQNQSEVFNRLSEGWFYTHTHTHTFTHTYTCMYTKGLFIFI